MFLFYRLFSGLLFLSITIPSLSISIIPVTYAASLPPVPGNAGMVVTSQHLATNVGAAILKQGGNAIDAAVAVGYALAVTDPCCGNIGGGGFMLIRFANGKTTFINFREKAPNAANPQLYLDSKGEPIPGAIDRGYLSVAIPGTVMGLNYALEKYGTLSLSTVMAPAIALASKGFLLAPYDISLFQASANDFRKEANVAAIFLKNRQSYQVGDRFIQKNLARSLSLIAKSGTGAFYKGPIADEIVKASQLHHGVMTKEDFANYTVRELQPIECDYHGYHLITAPPPSAGGVTLCEMLNVLSKYTFGAADFHDANSSHYIIEAMRYAYADRNHLIGDPDFIKNPIQELLSNQHAENIRQQIMPDKAGDSAKIRRGIHSYQEQDQKKEKAYTTHYSIVDQYGNAVSVTYTINDFFGSRVIAGNTGFFLNNEMDDFALKSDVPNTYQLFFQGTANEIQPNKRPVSSMTPTIMTKNNQLYLILGTPGGSTITTQLLQVIMNNIDFGMANLQAAIDMPHYHMQWLPDVVFMEAYTFSADTLEKLIAMGYHFQLGSPFNTPTWGAVAAIMCDAKTNLLFGAMDHRRPLGSAIGLMDKKEKPFLCGPSNNRNKSDTHNL